MNFINKESKSKRIQKYYRGGGRRGDGGGGLRGASVSNFCY